MKSLAKITWVLWWSENRKFPPQKMWFGGCSTMKKMWFDRLTIKYWDPPVKTTTVLSNSRAWWGFYLQNPFDEIFEHDNLDFLCNKNGNIYVIWWDELWFEDLRKRRRAQQKLFDPCIWVSISLSQVWSWSIYAVIERISANINVLMQSCLCDTSLCQQWTSMQSPNKDYFVILYINLGL